MKPMLAHKFDNSRVDWSEPVYIQPKLDGVRCLFTKDGAYSRTGKKFMNVRHIEMSLKSFFDDNPDVVLDGELYNHKLKHDFEKIISRYMAQDDPLDYTDFANGETRFNEYGGDTKEEIAKYNIVRRSAQKIVDILATK